MWDVIGDGEITTIADYATKHFEREGRPLRVAVDEAGWRFNNLTPDQVAKIREKEAAANPIEKTILWRILRLMKLNVQLIFVFDGPRRPWKRGRKGGGGNPAEYFERVKLLEQLLDHLKIPRHRVPAEAEAECAKMQQAGIVDVVWSDDSDTMMFGATCQMEAHKVNGKRVEGYIRVYRAGDLLAKYDFDDQSLVLFAMLSGGDYNVKGLPGCGPKTAEPFCRRETGLARELCAADKRSFPVWRARLADVMRSRNKTIEMPADFPDLKALNHYRNPTVSAPEQLQNLRGLRRGWDMEIDQMKLRVLLRQRFNIWTRGFLKHIGPIFVVQNLARCKSDETRVNNMRFDIKLKRVTKRKTDDGAEQPAPSETKITFYPLTAVDIDLSREPEEEDWTVLGTKAVPRFDPAAPVEAEILACFLKHGLPEGALEAPEPRAKPRKKKTATDPAPSTQSTNADVPTTNPTGTSASPYQSNPPLSTSVPKKRGRPKKDKTQADPEAAPTRRKKSKTKAAEAPPPATFRAARSIVFKPSTTIDIDESSSEDVLFIEQEAPAVNTSRQILGQDKVPPTSTTAIDLGKSSSDDELPALDIARPMAPPTASRQASSHNSDLLTATATCFHDIDSGDELPDLLYAHPPASQIVASRGRPSGSSKGILVAEAAMTPGEPISPATLRALRVASFAAPTSSNQTATSVASAPVARVTPRMPAQRVVIDLT